MAKGRKGGIQRGGESKLNFGIRYIRTIHPYMTTVTPTQIILNTILHANLIGELKSQVSTMSLPQVVFMSPSNFPETADSQDLYTSLKILSMYRFKYFFKKTSILI